MLVITPQRGSQPRVQHHPVATPEDSALYPLRCFSAPFATDAETFGYLQVQHLFADSFLTVHWQFGQRTTSGPCSPNLMSWRTVTATVERAAGFEPA